MTTFDANSLEGSLRDYYKHVFPFKPYTKWLCYGSKTADKFALREFAFILEGDTHLRYKSFPTELDFEKELCKISPQKLDVGAVYTHPPKDGKKYADFKPVEREFVLDIDLTDYENVRTCCTKATVCAKCWKFVALAVRILDKILEEDFGYTARMWVFSGRRGVHCWVGDAKARKLNNSQRQAVAEYMSLFSGEKMNVNFAVKKIRLHPMVEKAYKTALSNELFKNMIFEQQWLADSRLPFLLQHIDDEEMAGKIKKLFERCEKHEQRWEYLLKRFDEKTRVEHNEKVGEENAIEPPSTCINFLKWFVLYHCYPRLDVNVSTGINHLLKSPFCVHPATGNIAVPLKVSIIHKFDVNQAPRVDHLLKQLREANELPENRRVLGYKHTTLAPYVDNFDTFVEKALDSEAREKQKQTNAARPRNFL